MSSATIAAIENGAVEFDEKPRKMLIKRKKYAILRRSNVETNGFKSALEEEAE